MDEYYILDGHTPVLVDSVTWSTWFNTRPDRYVAQSEVEGRLVSTVFLGTNYRYPRGGPPLVFETMVFESPDTLQDIYCKRCSTWEEAEAQHIRAVEWVLYGEKDEE